VRYLSVCSGIEAATVAWHDLGWKPVGYSEIEPFPSAVLAHHYPNVTNFGDMTKYKEWNIEHPDILVGGTPCQSFSVAGLRKGLDDPRGNLALTYCGILDHFRPQWFVWENVPGVLSSNGGRDFGSFLGALAELGYGFAYRVLDAQFFRVAQRRRRVFVVGYLGDWRPSAAVLFERESLRRDTAPSRKAGKESAGSIAQCFEPRSPDGHARLIGDFSPTLNRMGGGQREPCVITDVCGTLTARSVTSLGIPEVDGGMFIPTTYSTPAIGNIRQDTTASCISRNTGGGGETQNPAFVVDKWPASVAPTMNAHFGTKQGLEDQPALGGAGMFVNPQAVRRLTPTECERLQGFPDNYTNIPWRKKEESPDGPRYKALGNSMAVPVMAWIGDGISYVEDRITSRTADRLTPRPR
jgi:DNA (cytosine-5)-methyltransferase 1